jgi:glycerophosphodiester phosphodiesterase
MKFGANLRKTQLPQWAHAYIDYTGLKYLIKATAASENADLTGTPFARRGMLADVALRILC